MSLTALLNRPVTIISRTESGTTDAYGNAIPDETTVTTVGELQQQQRTEPDQAGEFSDTRWLLILPAATSIDTSDVVVVDGLEYELEGEPWTVRNPRTGTNSHLEATVCRAAGAEDVT